MVHKNKSKVFWNSEEKKSIAIKALARWKTDLELVWQYLTAAQTEALSPERRRKVIPRNNTGHEILEIFNQLRSEALGLKAGVESEEPVVITLEKEVMVEIPREQMLESITNEEFIREAARRIAPVLSSLGSISQLVQVMSRERVAQAAVQEVVLKTRFESAPTPRKVKVLLFGFLPQQEHDIREKAAGFNLELVTCKRGEVQPLASWCVMMNKIGHQVYHKIKAAVGNDRLFMVDGTTEAMKKLAEINSLIGTGIR
jgi:hypothetical protein